MNTNIYGMYECEAENQFKVSKAFINIDGKNISLIEEIIFLYILIETIFYNTTTTATILSSKYQRTSSPSYGRFQYIW